MANIFESPSFTLAQLEHSVGQLPVTLPVTDDHDSDLQGSAVVLAASASVFSESTRRNFTSSEIQLYALASKHNWTESEFKELVQLITGLDFNIS